MIKAVIFDFFGVVVTDGLEATLAKLSKTDPVACDFIKETIRKNNLGMLMPAESNRLIAERLNEPVDTWIGQVHSGEVRNEALLEDIQNLRGKYKTALLSNVGKGSLERRMMDAELDKLFDVVVTSGEVGMIKPDPRIYKLTAEKLGAKPSECIFIDDREAYCTAAREVGMQAILYKDFAQFKRELEQILAG